MLPRSIGTAEPAHEAGGKIIDLMEALKARLATSDTAPASDDGAEEKPAAKRSTARPRKRKSA